MFVRITLPIVAALALIVACTVGLSAALAAPASAATVPHAPSLTEAETPPTESAYLWPGSRVTYAFDAPDGVGNCRYRGQDETPFFTDVSAYRWNGRAFAGRQEWQESGRMLWRDSAGRAVTFDGITFRNHTNRKVIVAGWCG